VVLNKLLAKLKDRGNFSILCMIGSVCIDRVLCEFNAPLNFQEA